MRLHGSCIALVVLLSAGAEPARTSAGSEIPHERIPLRVRPLMLTSSIEQLAGQRVIVSGARSVGMFGTRALIIDTATRLAPALERRDRVLVLVERGEIWVSPEQLVGSTVHVTGVARTLLGMQLSGEVPWPAELDRERIERLGVRAAVLATSVQTADGVELTARP